MTAFKSGDASMLSMLIGDRIKTWVEHEWLQTPFGLREHRGCADAIFGLRRHHEEALGMGKGILT